jgi:hypothetical protein
MFETEEYQTFREYLNLNEFSLYEITKETGVEYSKAITYLSKFLSEKSFINNH